MKYFNLIFAFILLCACDRSNQISDNGKWERIQNFEDSVVNGYALIDGKIYCGYFDIDFFDQYLIHQTEGYIAHADVGTFEICVGTDYARDKNAVYYPRELTFVDGRDSGGGFAIGYVVPNASPKKFIYLRNGYAVSGEHMYYEGEEIVWRDEIINESIPISDTTIYHNVLKGKSFWDRIFDKSY